MKREQFIKVVEEALDSLPQAPFTSYGPTVVVHSNGYEVESYVPGGERLQGSGTSAAAPNVVNLAAKMLAVNPALKPPDVICIMRDTADATPDGRPHLINPKEAAAARSTNPPRAPRHNTTKTTTPPKK